jgi:hypothetical protein
MASPPASRMRCTVHDRPDRDIHQLAQDTNSVIDAQMLGYQDGKSRCPEPPLLAAGEAVCNSRRARR